MSNVNKKKVKYNANLSQTNKKLISCHIKINIDLLFDHWKTYCRIYKNDIKFLIHTW